MCTRDLTLGEVGHDRGLAFGHLYVSSRVGRDYDGKHHCFFATRFWRSTRDGVGLAFSDFFFQEIFSSKNFLFISPASQLDNYKVFSSTWGSGILDSLFQ